MAVLIAETKLETVDTAWYHFYIDKVADIESLPTSCSIGIAFSVKKYARPTSVAYCIEDAHVYMLDSHDKWRPMYGFSDDVLDALDVKTSDFFKICSETKNYRDEAVSNANSSAESAAAALASQNAAKNSETKSAASEAVAKRSEQSAAAAAAAASSSKTSAAASEATVKASATAAAESQAKAAESEKNAKASETLAGTSATNASTSAKNAASSATTATDAATTASEKATAASSSATNAAASAKTAEKSEANAKIYAEKAQLIGDSYKGWYQTEKELAADLTEAKNGDWAIVGESDTMWVWDGDTGAWVNTRKEVDLSDYMTQDQIMKLLEQYMPLRPATATTLGGIKVGSGLSVTEDGMLSADAQEYTLPAATATTLGGVKVGSGLTVDADGTLSADSALAAYPVGSIFQTVSTTSPAELFGGTWQEIAFNRVLMGAGTGHTAGSTVEAGLPNITGSFTTKSTDVGGSPFSGDANVLSAKGSLAFSEKSTSYGGYTGHSGSQYNIQFDASRSNPIYGRSYTVQPAAYYVHIWKRVA